MNLNDRSDVEGNELVGDDHNNHQLSAEDVPAPFELNMSQEAFAKADANHIKSIMSNNNNNINYSYMTGGSEKQTMSHHNLQYFDKHDYNQEPNGPTVKKNVIDAYNKLQDYVADVHQQITDKMKKSEEEFLYVYKQQMSTIQEELKVLKRKMDDEVLRQKANDKMNILTEERDYFKTEALRLDRMCKHQEREIEELSFKQKVLTEDKNYYEGFVIETKKENKALKSELLQLYKSKTAEQSQNKHMQQAGTQLQRMLGSNYQQDRRQSQPTPAPLDTENEFQLQNQQDYRQFTTQLNTRHMSNPSEDIFLSEVKLWNPNSQSLPQFNPAGTGFSYGKQPPGTAATGSRKDLTNTVQSTLSSQPAISSAQNFFTAQSRTQTASQQIRKRTKKFPQEFNASETLSGQKKEEILQDESKHLETIKSLRTYLEKEKNALSKAKAELAQIYSDRSELEMILLDCIQETKKEINRRKAVQRADQMGLSGNNLKQSLVNLRIAMNLESEEEVAYSAFNSKDKMETLKAFLSNDLFLDQIYQITFGHSKLPKQDQKIVDLGLTEQIPLRASQSNTDTRFKLAESWKHDAQQASQMFQNFKGFKYSFKPQTNSGCKNVSGRELKSPLFNFTDKTNKNIRMIQSTAIESPTAAAANTNLVQKHKLYKEVCKEFSQKAQLQQQLLQQKNILS